MVTTDRCADADLHSALRLGGPSATTLVVFEAGATPGIEPGVGRVPPVHSARWGAGRGPGSWAAGRRAVWVRRGDTFAQAWAVHARKSVSA